MKRFGGVPQRLAVLPLAVSVSAWAESPQILDKVVVTATRSEQVSVPTPATVTVIDAAQIRASGATNLADFLRSRGGSVVTDLYGAGTKTSIGLRGFSASAHSNTLVLVDGRRLNNGDIAAPQLSQISMKDVARIELLQGSAGVLYGDQAVGGVVNVITRHPEAAKARLSAGFDAFGGDRQVAEFERGFDNGLAVRVSAERRDTPNYRAHNRLQMENYFARLEYEFANGVVFGELLRSYEDLETPGALTAAQAAADRRQAPVAFRNDSSDTDTRVARLGGELSLNDRWSVLAEFTRSDSDNPFVQFGGASHQERSLDSITPRLIGAFPFNGGEALVTLGADLEQASYRIRSAFVNRNNTFDNEAFYAHLVLPLTERLSVTGGTRHARQSNRITDALTYPGGQDFLFEETVAEIGLSYRFDAAWRVFGRVDENFRFPKIDEQGYTSPGNVLKPQTGESWEAGVSWQDGGAGVEFNLYRLDLADEIAFDATATPPLGAFFAGANVNLDPTRHQGMSVDVHWPLGHRATLWANYAYTDARFRSGANAGKQIGYVPRHSARVSAEYRPRPAWSVFAELVFTGDRHASGDNANTAPTVGSDTVVNFSTRYDFGALEVTARLNNVFNERYNGFESLFGVYPAPERNGSIEFAWEFD